MGREDLIGNSKKHLVRAFQPTVMGAIRQTDGRTFISNKAMPLKNGSLPKSFNNMKNATHSIKVDRKSR